MEEDVRGMTATERSKLYRYILPPLMQEVNIDEQSERVIIHIDHNI